MQLERCVQFCIPMYYYASTYLYAGLRFWKTGSRKIFAVKEEDVERLRGKGKYKRSAIVLNSDDEDEDSDEFRNA